MTTSEKPKDLGSYIGVDGCPGGWVAMVWEPEADRVEPLFVRSIAALLHRFPGATIGIDMPIGLSTTGRRQCDFDARKFLSPLRASSIFPPPVPGILDAESYKDACSRSFSLVGKKISQQTFALFPKLREVQQAVTPAIQNRVFEIHPDVCFAALARHPMVHPKRTPAGYEERRGYLQQAMGISLPDRSLIGSWVPPAQPDDVLDALAGAWTARRFAEGRAERFPVIEERDELGLRMEMVY